MLGQLVQGLVHRDHICVRTDHRDVERGRQVYALEAATVFEALLATGVLHQDAAHCLGRCGEEVAAAVPMPGSGANEPQVGLVHQRGRLERLTWGFVGHPLARETTQLLIDQGQ